MHRFTLEDDPSQDDLDALSRGLTEHSLPFAGGVPGFVKGYQRFFLEKAL